MHKAAQQAATAEASEAQLYAMMTKHDQPTTTPQLVFCLSFEAECYTTAR